jgi:tetratricopeptide (TPR) repeat protein
MTDDIEEAAETGNVLAELNARSIRAFLDSEVGAIDAWIEDTEKFLELADGVLPSDALFYERLAVARALRAGDELDDAKAIIMSVLDEAQARSDKDLIYAALFQLALTELDHDQPESALLVLADLEDMSDQLSDEERAELNSVAGVLYAEAGKPREAANRIVESLRIVQELDDASLRARISVRAASALITTGRSLESIQYLQSAVVGYTESYQFDEAAETLARLAYQELTVANENAGRDSSGPQLVALAREHLANASESLVVLGRDLEAASQFFALGVLEFRIGNYDGARIFLDRAREFSLRSADYEALAAIAQQRAELASEAGDTLAEQQFREESSMWMDAAGIDEAEVPGQVDSEATTAPASEEAAE